jgi:hypothetical protein
MENREQQALIPRKQALVPFRQKKIFGVHLLDDHLAAGINSLCAMLGLAAKAQVRRIRRDKELSRYLLLVKVETSGGPQYMDVLIVEAIPSWVMGLNLKAIAPVKRPLILALKAEAVEVFYRYFFKTDPGQVSRPIAPQTRRPALAGRKPQQLTRPSREGGAAELAGIKAAIRRLEAGLDGMQATVQEVKAALEEMQAAIREMQQKQQDVEARVQTQALTFEAFQAQTDVRVAWLEHWRRIAVGASDGARPEAEELASFTLVRDLARLLAASIERLLEVQGRVDQLEPKPPPRPTRRGRPRRDHQH